MKLIPRQFSGLLLMCAGLAMTTLALAKLWLAPNVFVATARVQAPGPEPATGHGTNNAPVVESGPGWSPTEVERIHAKVVLYQVITNLDLQRKWGEQFKQEGPLPIDKAYQYLSKQMNVRQSGNTSLIDISVQSYASAEAATLANRIAEVYRDTRRADGSAVQIVGSAQPPPKGQRSGASSALALFLAGLAGLGAGYWVLRSAGLFRPPPPS